MFVSVSARSAEAASEKTERLTFICVFCAVEHRNAVKDYVDRQTGIGLCNYASECLLCHAMLLLEVRSPIRAQWKA